MAVQLTHKSMKWLRKQHFIVDKVESWNPFSRTSKDMFGFADLVALGEHSIIAVQVTSHSNKSARIHKILDSPSALAWLLNGGRIWVLTWKQVKTKWIPCITEVMEVDYGRGTTDDSCCN